jgi:hypothetical protein
MRSIGLPELVVVLGVIVLLVAILKSRSKAGSQGAQPPPTRVHTLGSSAYHRRHLGNCTKCGADLDTDDPHAPGCPRGGG